jgi:hypothetical protein
MEDLHVTEAVRPRPIGGYTASSCLNRLGVVIQHDFVRVLTPNGARPPLHININGHDRFCLIQPIKYIYSLSFCLYFHLFALNFPIYNLLFFLSLRDVRRRSRWPANLRATLCASSLTGSLPSRRS